MDRRELVGGRLRFTRSTFDNFTAFVFPLAGRQTLVVALESKNLMSGAIAKVVQLLKSLDEDSPIDQREMKDSLFCVRTSTISVQTASMSATSTSSTASSATNENMTEHVSVGSTSQWIETSGERRDEMSGSLQRRRRTRVVRSQTMIVRAILEACRTPSAQHWIMIRAKLGYETFWMHIKTLMAQGLLKEERGDGNRVLYSITESGLSCLHQLPQD